MTRKIWNFLFKFSNFFIV